MPIRILKLPYLAFKCLVEQFDSIDVIHLCAYFKSFVSHVARSRIVVETLEFRITDDTFLASWNNLELKISLRTYYNPYGPGVCLESISQYPRQLPIGLRPKNETISITNVSESLTYFEKVEKVLDRILPVLKIQNFDFNFCSNLSINIRDLFIWKITSTFRNFSITPPPRYAVILSPEDIRFYLEDIQMDTLTLDVQCLDPDYRYRGILRAQKVTLGRNTSWLNLSILTWTSSEVELHIASEDDLRDFLRVWVNSDNITLKIVTATCPDHRYRPQNIFRWVSQNIIGDAGIDVGHVAELVLDIFPNNEATVRTIRRQTDGVEARVTLRRSSFRFEVLEREEVQQYG